jgi:hypothetical protein
VADKPEKQVDLKSYVILRNFSGEDFDKARIMLDYGESFEQGIDHEETKQLLFLKEPNVPITKIWKFDSAVQIWDPEQLENKNVGIPVSYRIINDAKSNLGDYALWGGKARIYQDDGHESTIILGEDNAILAPVGEKMELYIGESRDIVVTQKQLRDERTNVMRTRDGRSIVMYDTTEEIEAKVENFKDSPAVLTMIQHIAGEWDMESCAIDNQKLTLNNGFKKKDANTLEFEITLPARTETGPATKKLVMLYHRRHVRDGVAPRPDIMSAPIRR